jgi:hypothetical protein
MTDAESEADITSSENDFAASRKRPIADVRQWLLYGWKIDHVKFGFVPEGDTRSCPYYYAYADRQG